MNIKRKIIIVWLVLSALICVLSASTIGFEYNVSSTGKYQEIATVTVADATFMSIGLIFIFSIIMLMAYVGSQKERK